MRAAVNSKEGGQWVDASGVPLTLPLPTSNDTPRWEPTVASQLTEFGIDTTVQALGETTFRDRLRNGEFPMWAELGTSTSTAASTLTFWRWVAAARDRCGIYPEEQLSTGKFSTGMDRPPNSRR